MKLVEDKKVKPVFRNEYDRLAYIALEVLTKNQTEFQLAAQLGLSHQRVSQLFIKALERVGCTHNPDPHLVALRFRRYVAREQLDEDHIEVFTRREMLFRGKFTPYWIP